MLKRWLALLFLLLPVMPATASQDGFLSRCWAIMSGKNPSSGNTVKESPVNDDLRPLSLRSLSREVTLRKADQVQEYVVELENLIMASDEPVDIVNFLMKVQRSEVFEGTGIVLDLRNLSCVPLPVLDKESLNELAKNLRKPQWRRSPDDNLLMLKVPPIITFPDKNLDTAESELILRKARIEGCLNNLRLARKLFLTE